MLAKKSTKETARFNGKAVRENIDRLKEIADIEFGPKSGRRDFYNYLSEVYRFVRTWRKANRDNRLRSHVAELQGLNGPRPNADAFHMVIDATCPKKKGSKSKFAIALWNADQMGVSPQKLVSFLEDISGPTTICTRVSKKKLVKIIGAAKKRRVNSGKLSKATKSGIIKSAIEARRRLRKSSISSKDQENDDWN